MSTQLHKLPLDIVYRIFDYLNQNDLLLSVSHVCQRLDRILSSYEQFQVKIRTRIVSLFDKKFT